MDAKLRASRERPHGSAGGEGIRRHRMRFSVTSRHPGSVEQPPARLRGTMGNGSTGQMRSSNPPPGCGALWGMAQLGKCARATPRQAAGHYGEWLNWANALEQPPARLRGTMGNGSTGQMRSSNPPPGCGAACARVRKSRFGVWPHGKAHFATPPRGAIT